MKMLDRDTVLKLIVDRTYEYEVLANDYRTKGRNDTARLMEGKATSMAMLYQDIVALEPIEVEQDQ